MEKKMIGIEERGQVITATIDGKQYQLLSRVAEAMNRATWTGNDNTALSVFKNFVFPWIGDDFQEPCLLCEEILGGVATGENGTDAPAPLHRARLEELRAAFEAAGLLSTDAACGEEEEEKGDGDGDYHLVNLDLPLDLVRRLEKCAERDGVGLEDEIVRIMAEEVKQ